jgi:hypothetical protein
MANTIVKCESNWFFFFALSTWCDRSRQLGFWPEPACPEKSQPLHGSMIDTWVQTWMWGGRSKGSLCSSGVQLYRNKPVLCPDAVAPVVFATFSFRGVVQIHARIWIMYTVYYSLMSFNSWNSSVPRSLHFQTILWATSSVLSCLRWIRGMALCSYPMEPRDWRREASGD